jgi:hypothetical protein
VDGVDVAYDLVTAHEPFRIARGPNIAELVLVDG